MGSFEDRSIRECLQVPFFHVFRTIFSQVIRQSRKDIMFVDLGDHSFVHMVLVGHRQSNCRGQVGKRRQTFSMDPKKRFC
jgi:hypothetical protein